MPPPAVPPPSSRRLVCLQAGAIVLAALWIFSPAFHGSWLWDDGLEIGGNTLLRNWQGLAKIWVAPQGWDYFPLKTTAQWLEWHLWQDSVLGYHLINVGLHVLSGLLIWRLLLKLGVRLGWLGGLLFVVHPLAVESVAWIAEFKNDLSLPFLLLSLIAYVDFRQRAGAPKAVRAYFLSLAFFLAAMLCKSSVVMYPFVLLLYGWWRGGRSAWSRIKPSLPFFGISVVLGLVTVWFQHQRAIGQEFIPMGGGFSRLAGAGLAIGFYVLKCLWPFRLSPNYPPWNFDHPTALQWLPWLALVGIFAWLWSRREGWGRHALFGLGWFVINLAPVLGFIPMSYLRISLVADHFAYLSLVGMAGLAAAGFDRWQFRLAPRVSTGSRRGMVGSVLPMTCALALVAVLAWESHGYAAAFSSEEANARCALQRAPGSWFVHFRMGNVLHEQGKSAEAMEQYRLALDLFPPSAEAHCNLGNLLFEAGRNSEAVDQFREAVRLLPNYPEGQNGLAMALGEAGDLSGAVLHGQQALQLKPDFPEARNNLANMLLRLGRADEAIAQYREALQLKPDFPEARNNLGVALSFTGRLTEAIAEYREALRLRPDYADARRNLNDALARTVRTQTGSGDAH